MRQIFEFYCNECLKYFDIKLNVSLNGNHRIHCPNCEHIHYRFIKNGEITETRFTRNPTDFIVDDIQPMKASCRDYQTETTEENLLTVKGYIRRLWKERFSVKT